MPIWGPTAWRDIQTSRMFRSDSNETFVIKLIRNYLWDFFLTEEETVYILSTTTGCPPPHFATHPPPLLPESFKIKTVKLFLKVKNPLCQSNIVSFWTQWSRKKLPFWVAMYNRDPVGNMTVSIGIILIGWRSNNVYIQPTITPINIYYYFVYKLRNIKKAACKN